MAIPLTCPRLRLLQPLLLCWIFLGADGEDPVRFRTMVSEVQVSFSALDQNNHGVATLQASDFAVSQSAVKKSGVGVPKGGTVLLCTGHHARTFPSRAYSTDNSGVNVAATEWLAKQGVVHFGIDSMRPGPDSDVNLWVHKVCLDLDITHIESLCNLESLLGQGQFTFIGLPMKWREGTASPIRAVAVFGLQ